jgi:hypothetical protein
VTIFGDVYQLPNDLQEAAREIFLQKLVRSLYFLCGSLAAVRSRAVYRVTCPWLLPSA